jgi:hypothetical protein
MLDRNQAGRAAILPKDDIVLHSLDVGVQPAHVAGVTNTTAKDQPDGCIFFGRRSDTQPIAGVGQRVRTGGCPYP